MTILQPDHRQNPSSTVLTYWNISQSDTPPLRPHRLLAQSYLQHFSSIKKIRECAPFQRCNNPLAAECSHRAAERAQKAVSARMPKTGCLRFTLTIQDIADLELGFDRLMAVRRIFSSKIKNLVSAYDFPIELTDSDPRWHWHSHPLMWSVTDPEQIIQLWLDSAVTLGIRADRRGQDYVQQTAEEAITYVHKSRLGFESPDGWEAGSLGDTLTRAAQGDAGAAERWAIVEAFNSSRRRQWRFSWVAPAIEPKAPTASTFDYDRSPDLSRLTLLDYLQVTGRSQQSKIMILAGHTVSTATVSRMRRHPRMTGRDTPPPAETASMASDGPTEPESITSEQLDALLRTEPPRPLHDVDRVLRAASRRQIDFDDLFDPEPDSPRTLPRPLAKVAGERPCR